MLMHTRILQDCAAGKNWQKECVRSARGNRQGEKKKLLQEASLFFSLSSSYSLCRVQEYRFLVVLSRVAGEWR